MLFYEFFDSALVLFDRKEMACFIEPLEFYLNPTRRKYEIDLLTWKISAFAYPVMHC